MTAARTQDSSAGQLREALMVCAAAAMTGVLRVTGDPGGAIHLSGGRVTAIETPGAPGPEVLLLRSRRLTESSWDAAFAAAAAAGTPMNAELIIRGLAGAGELEALLRTALADAMYALASGTVQDYRAEPGPAPAMLPLEPGAEPAALLAETSRRLAILAALPARHDRDRIIAAPQAARPHIRLGDGQDEILALADGRRTPRDLAFALGRGVYATTLQLTRMHQAGLLATLPPRTPQTTPSPPGHPASPGLPPGLPRRQRDQPAPPRRPWTPGRAPELRTPPALLQPRSGRDADTGESPQPHSHMQ